MKGGNIQFLLDPSIFFFPLLSNGRSGRAPAPRPRTLSSQDFLPRKKTSSRRSREQEFLTKDTCLQLRSGVGNFIVFFWKFLLPHSLIWGSASLAQALCSQVSLPCAQPNDVWRQATQGTHGVDPSFSSTREHWATRHCFYCFFFVFFSVSPRLFFCFFAAAFFHSSWSTWRSGVAAARLRRL